MSKRRLIIGTVVLAVVAAWYVFRPETAFIDRQVNEPPPGPAATILLTGSFVPREHGGRGLVQVLELSGGQRVLRFSDFETLDGPDLQVYLLGAPNAARTEDLKKTEYLSLGRLKGNVGPQNYPIPAGTDLAKYRAVAVWCRRFGVNFTTAQFETRSPPGS